MDDFDSDKWPLLSAAERLHLCRAAAQSAERDANVDPGLRDLYLDLAASWHRLAYELERQTDGSF